MDLIIIGSQGRTYTEALIIGSVSEAIIKNSNKPILFFLKFLKILQIVFLRIFDNFNKTQALKFCSLNPVLLAWDFYFHK